LPEDQVVSALRLTSSEAIKIIQNRLKCIFQILIHNVLKELKWVLSGTTSSLLHCDRRLNSPESTTLTLQVSLVAYMGDCYAGVGGTAGGGDQQCGQDHLEDADAEVAGPINAGQSADWRIIRGSARAGSSVSVQRI